MTCLAIPTPSDLAFSFARGFSNTSAASIGSVRATLTMIVGPGLIFSIMIPPIAGPTSRAALKLMDMSAMAFDSASRGTSKGMRVRRIGVLALAVTPNRNAMTERIQMSSRSSANRMPSTAVRMVSSACVASAPRWMSMRSARTPKNGPAKSVGAKSRNDTMPTQDADAVSVQPSQPRMTRLIQMALSEMKLTAT